MKGSCNSPSNLDYAQPTDLKVLRVACAIACGESAV
jgi:hypothetical protein